MAKIPGFGPRSARRSVLSLIKNPNDLMLPLANKLIETAKNIKKCKICGNLDTDIICRRFVVLLPAWIYTPGISLTKILK